MRTRWSIAMVSVTTTGARSEPGGQIPPTGRAGMINALDGIVRSRRRWAGGYTGAWGL
ncbi:hypothetical protein ABN028_33025 [Actinopolymorpha sp. B17G11]|uniref:hypothetical protein n=1 Tax=Actinopolymorpha sp. B17G11 TaxID=3160861 RepID=UPI0032E41DFB